ncbi:MAG: alkylhydroperoxidase-related (seleno)protein [Chloroflexota bacterium]
MMAEPSYDFAPVRVREDLVAAHRRVWEHISRPGTWWTGEQRRAMAAETRHARDCRLCRERATSASSSKMRGRHDGLGGLPEPIVDIVHRLTNEPGRLSKDWFNEVLAKGVTEAAYVEVVGVVTQTVNVDTFCHGLGVAYHSLPAPALGEPSRHRPEGARPERAWVPMVSPANAKGPEAGLYPLGGVPNVGRALSLVPDETRSVLDLLAAQYIPAGRVSDFWFDPQRAISRAQMDLLAGRVSALNRCFY